MSDFNQSPFSENEEISKDRSVIAEEPLSDQETPVADEPSEPKDAPKKKTSLAVELLDYVEVFVFAICVVILLFSFCFRLCQVKGSSMEHTLLNQESLVVSDLFYTPKREDIIVFHQTGSLNEPVVKRVIATAGETVYIDHEYHTMTITITDANGSQTVLREDYMYYDGVPLYLNDMTVTVPDGYVFVLGDNRNGSKDSRHPDIGLVDERRVLGKVLFRVSPLSRFGTVD